MGRPARVSAQDVEDAAFTLVRTRGEAALTARAVAEALGVSTQPVYSTYGSMDDLRAGVQGRAAAFVERYLSAPEPGTAPMLALGVRTIRLAIEEPALYALAAGWMRGRLGEPPPPPILAALRADPRLRHASDTDLARINALLWIFTQGVAAVVDPADGLVALAQARQWLEAAGEAVISSYAGRHS